MSDKINIADQLDAILNRERSLGEAARILRGIGAFEQAESEAKNAAAAARQEAETVLANLAAVNADIETAKSDAAALRSKGEKDAAEIRGSAQLEAGKIVGKARQDAELMLASARLDEERISERAKDAADKAAAQAKEAKASVAQAAAKKAALDAECAEVEARVVKAKDYLKRLQE